MTRTDVSIGSCHVGVSKRFSRSISFAVFCYLQGVEELNSGPPKTNPSSGREEDLNLGPPRDQCLKTF